MGVYAELVDISPESFKPGDTVTAKVDIYNNERAKYVTVEIKDETTGKTIWKWQEFTQLGVTSVTKTLTAPQDIPSGNLCLQAYANGNTLPEEPFKVLEIYVNDELVWKDGKQIKTAWMEFEHFGDGRLSYNTVRVKYFAIPLYSSKMKVYARLERVDCPFSTDSVDDFAYEGINEVELKLWGLGDAAWLYTTIKTIKDWQFFTRVLWQYTANDNWIECPPNRNEIAKTTIPASGAYGLLFKGVHDNTVGRSIKVEVTLNGYTIHSFYTKDNPEDVMVYFEANSGDTLSIYATPQCKDSICPWLIIEDLALVKEVEKYCTIEVYLNPNDYKSVRIPIKVRGYYDEWFGGKRNVCTKEFENYLIQKVCSANLSDRNEVARIINEIANEYNSAGCKSAVIDELVHDLVSLYFRAMSESDFRSKWCS